MKSFMHLDSTPNRLQRLFNHAQIQPAETCTRYLPEFNVTAHLKIIPDKRVIFGIATTDNAPPPSMATWRGVLAWLPDEISQLPEPKAANRNGDHYLYAEIDLAAEYPKVGIDSCKMIYEPSGRAREYAGLACNVYSGCAHGCLYCFAPAITYKTRQKFSQAGKRPAGFLKAVEREASKYKNAGITEPVLLSFTTDPYQPLNDQEKVTRKVIRILHRNDLPVSILTKGGLRATADMDLLDGADAFGTSLSILTSHLVEQWEPHAAPPADRIKAMREFHAAGIPVWVSIEPVIFPVEALQVILETHDFVDHYKIGKLNYAAPPKPVDWSEFTQAAVGLLDDLEKDYYLKKSLQEFDPRSAG